MKTSSHHKMQTGYSEAKKGWLTQYAGGSQTLPHHKSIK